MSGRLPVVLMGDLTLVRPLVMAQIPFVLVTPDENDATLRSRFVHEHLVVDDWNETAIAPLLALGTRLQRQHGRKAPLFCGNDSQLELIYAHREQLAAVFALVMNPPELAWALNDKSAFYALCEQKGVLAPRTIGEHEDPEAAITRLREPILVKPRRKIDLTELREPFFGPASKARVFATREELMTHPGWAAHKHQLIVQEHVVGEVDSLCSFHGYADEQGRLLAWFCGRKVRTYPSFGGESSFVELVHDSGIERRGRELVDKLGIIGAFKVDFIREPSTGELWTLEVNARFTLWCYLAAVSGVNLLEVAYDHAVHGRAPRESPVRYQVGRRWVSLYRDLRAYREVHARGELGLGAWLRSVAAPGNVYEVFAWTDPLPFASWLAQLVSKKLAT